MNPIKGEQLLTQLNCRYAVKQFDPTRKISPEDWATLEHALILSPSSYGLQPWTFIVITDRKMRERLFPATWNPRLLALRRPRGENEDELRTALGTFMASAALIGIDTCPMEGFQTHEYDKILDLAKGLASVVCCAAGYRAPGDKYATQKKVQFPREQVIHII